MGGPTCETKRLLAVTTIGSEKLGWKKRKMDYNGETKTYRKQGRYEKRNRYAMMGKRKWYAQLGGNGA